MRIRATKVEAPDAVRPHRRFDTVSAALAGFGVVRGRSLQFIQERGEEALYSLSAKHPYFGDLNGAEWMQLIDGHARRHLDQIRETCEAVERAKDTGMKPVAARKPAVFRRDAPDLPVELESLEDVDELFADPELVTIQETRLQTLERKNLKLDALHIEGSVLQHVQLDGGEFGSAVWKDVRLEQCDLANVRAHRITLVRVELIDCRLTGFGSSAVEWQDVLIRNGDLRYARLSGGKFRTCEFDGCNWAEADLQDADLSGSVLRSCDLARADLRGAKLQRTDFRRSAVEGMQVGMNDLRGAIVDPAQAMVFAKILGLQIM